MGDTAMRHFSTEQWIDFVNQLVSSEQHKAMQEHLATGCERCTKAVSLWQKVRQTARAEAAYKPSPDSVRLAKAAYATSGLAKKQKEASSVVELLFDSFRQPALAGARGMLIGTRQMLYRVDPYQMDIQIEPKTGANRLVITGQLLELGSSGATAQGIPVTLSNRRGNSVVTTTNQFGEFSGEIENSGDLELSIPSDSGAPKVISLRSPLDRFSGGKA